MLNYYIENNYHWNRKHELYMDVVGYQLFVGNTVE